MPYPTPPPVAYQRISHRLRARRGRRGRVAGWRTASTALRLMFPSAPVDKHLACPFTDAISSAEGCNPSPLPPTAAPGCLPASASAGRCRGSASTAAGNRIPPKRLGSDARSFSPADSSRPPGRDRPLHREDYMHNDPATARLVATPDQWPWSSFRFYYLNDSSAVAMDHVP